MVIQVQNVSVLPTLPSPPLVDDVIYAEDCVGITTAAKERSPSARGKSRTLTTDSHMSSFRLVTTRRDMQVVSVHLTSGHKPILRLLSRLKLANLAFIRAWEYDELVLSSARAHDSYVMPSNWHSSRARVSLFSQNVQRPPNDEAVFSD